MIVDLSSRAQGDNEEKSTSPIPSSSGDTSHLLNGSGSAGDYDAGQQSSPAKMFKAFEGCKHHRAHHNHLRQKSISQKYITPDTPVHKPYRLAAAMAAAAAVSKFNQYSQPASFSQSATNTPLKTTNRRRRQSGNNQRATSGRLSFDSECPLPLPPPSVPFRRKLSSSAKRFFDGSLRSLTGLGSAGPGGYTTSEDFDSEDCEALVSGNSSHNHGRRRKRASAGPSARHQSQPCSPMRHGYKDATSKIDRTAGTSWFNRASVSNSSQGQSTLDLSQLRAQVVQKLRQTTSWLSASSDKLEIDVGKSAQSGTKRSRWVHKSGGTCGGRQTELGYTESIRAGSSSSSHSSSTSSASSSDESLDFSSDDDADEKKAMSFLDHALVQTKWFKKSSNRHSTSARDLNELGRMSLDGPAAALPAHNSRSRKPEDRGRKRAQSRPRSRRRRRTKKSICQNSNCCCSREIKLSNRPPVWNEYSQVYQLDFGGRVTQESAKNLQIDFNGNLALQFGRVDKCTYTLDYKYPFNAVQAMSIALASLTQRLK